MKSLALTFMFAVTVAFLSTGLAARQEHKADAATDLTGVWVMLVEGHQIGLELEQDGTKVLGVMLAMGSRQLLEGTFVDQTLTLRGEKPEDGSLGPHGGGAASGAGPIVAKLLDDGTLDGELSTSRGRAKWTGERLKKQ